MYYLIYFVLIIGYWLLVINKQYVCNVTLYLLFSCRLQDVCHVELAHIVSGRPQGNFMSLFAAAHCIVFLTQWFCEFPHKPVTKSKYG